MDRGELEGLDRESLVIRAQAAGVRRARILTRPELIDELLRADPHADEAQLRRSRGFFGKARDLVARVVERGLHLPDAADRIRTLTRAEPPYVAPRTEPQAMPTVTLAEIYAAQGHDRRAVETLRRVLEREPDHVAARTLLARLVDDAYVAPPPPLPPEPEVEPDLNPPEEADEAVAGIMHIAGPSYGDDGGAEFHLVPSSLAPGSFGHTHAIIAAEDKVVDALAVTGIVEVVPDIEEADECFAIPLQGQLPGDETRIYVRWRVSFTAIGTQLGLRPQGRLVVRAHVVTPSWEGPLAETRDLTIDPDAEESLLQGLPGGSVVRVAVGWLDGDGFVPFAHSPALELSTRGLAIWTPSGPIPVVLDDPRVASLARAFDCSQRADELRV